MTPNSTPDGTPSPAPTPTGQPVREDPSRDLIGPEQAAAELGLTVEELARMRALGAGPEWALLTRTMIRYSRRDLATWTTGGRQS